MQDRYAGDIGDFVKLSILRALMPGYRLGVAWWLYPDENRTGDGKHITYLQNPAGWRHLDLELFDELKKIVDTKRRCVYSLQEAGILANAVFADERIPTCGSPGDRRKAREDWFDRTKMALADCDLVFLDPDNGLETAGYSPGTKIGGKSVSLSELRGLAAPGRVLMVYHHQTRRRGGHFAEIEHWATRLRAAGFGRVDALRSKPYSPRAFFLLGATPDIRDRAERLTHRWSEKLSWHPDNHATPDASHPSQPDAVP